MISAGVPNGRIAGPGDSTGLLAGEWGAGRRGCRGQEGREEDGRLWGLGPYKSPMWLKVKFGKVSLEDGYENWGLIK